MKKKNSVTQLNEVSAPVNKVHQRKADCQKFQSNDSKLQIVIMYRKKLIRGTIIIQVFTVINQTAISFFNYEFQYNMLISKFLIFLKSIKGIFFYKQVNFYHGQAQRCK